MLRSRLFSLGRDVLDKRSYVRLQALVVIRGVQDQKIKFRLCAPSLPQKIGSACALCFQFPAARHILQQTPATPGRRSCDRCPICNSFKLHLRVALGRIRMRCVNKPYMLFD
jgi:hypothetical protein